MLLTPWTEESFVAPADAHRPVLPDEVRELLAPRPGRVFVDGTLGLGGHAALLLDGLVPGGRLIGIDRDADALAIARERLARFGDAFVPCRGEHERIRELVAELGLDAVDGILLDLGVSSMQLDRPERGFSFRHDAPLDMRMDRGSGASAADLVREADEDELARILRTYGEERRARAIARAIVRRREVEPILTTGALAELVADVQGPAARRFRIHPATRTFQALRIAVNGEIDRLERTIADAIDLLRTGGRLVVIAYHSLESRAVKRAMRLAEPHCICPRTSPVCDCGRPGTVRAIARRAVRPGADEIAANPRARSAQLRAVERL